MEVELKRLGEQSTKQTKLMEEGFQDFTKSTEKSAKNFEVKTGRAFIRSISAIYATTRLMPQIAAEFGESLQEAAAGAATRQAFGNLTEDSRVVADSLIADMQRASRGTIREIELMQRANRAFLVGGREFALALPRLLEISRAAAVSTGQDVTFVFDSLTKGIARASVKLIDNAEIYLKIGSVVDDYAAAQGRAADELSFAEKQQVILNEVLEQGGDIIRSVGDDVEFASDKFNEFQADIDDIKQGILETALETEGLGDALPYLAIGAQEANESVFPLVQTLALLSIAGVSFSAVLTTIGLGAAKLGALISSPLGIALTAVFGLTEATSRAMQHFGVSIRGVDDPIDELTTALEAIFIQLTQGTDAAREFNRQQGVLVDPVKDNAEAVAQAQQVLEDYQATLGVGPSAHEAYIEKAEFLNEVLEYAGFDILPTLTAKQFEYFQVIESGAGSLELQIKLQERYIKALLSTGSVLDVINAAGIAYELLLDRQAKANEEATEAANRRAEAEENLADVFKDLNKLYDKRRSLEDRFLDKLVDARRDIEEAERDFAKEMEDIAEDQYEKRKDAEDDFSKAVRDAERDRARSIEEARRRHAFRMEDIERDYRRRLTEIEEDYNKSVFQAALDRDALALFRAKQRRGEETRDAQRDRQDAIRDEERDFSETLRRIDQQFNDRIQRAKESLAEQEQDLRESLAKRQQDEAEDHAERMAKLQQRLADIQRDYTNEMNAINAVIRSKRNEMQRWLNANPVVIPVRTQGPRRRPGRRGGNADAGFEGVVQGPTSISVGSGVTEYIYASGDLNRQQGLPSVAAAQTQQMRHAVSGAVGVGMTGFSDSLMSQVGPGLRDMIGQAVIDQLAEEILRL
jgi:hypothetical protein